MDHTIMSVKRKLRQNHLSGEFLLDSYNLIGVRKWQRQRLFALGARRLSLKEKP